MTSPRIHAIRTLEDPQDPWPLCGERPFLTTHLTRDVALVTCRACKARLTAPMPPDEETP